MFGHRYPYTPYSARYGARNPRLAPFALSGLYLIWRLAVAVFRPVLLLSLVIMGVLFVWRALDRTYVELPLNASPTQRLYLVMHNRLGEQGQDLWYDYIWSALSARSSKLPDLVLAESLAVSLTHFISSEHLALKLLQNEKKQGRDQLEAIFRARSSWQSNQELSVYLDQQVQTLATKGTYPAQLGFADQRLIDRFERTQILYDPIIKAAERWLANPTRQSLTLSALPGLSDLPKNSIMYDDIRDQVIQMCALVEASGVRFGPCRTAYLPKPPSNTLNASVSLVLPALNSKEALGARILKAASFTGKLKDAFWLEVMLSDDLGVGRQAAMDSSQRLLAEAGQVYIQPDQFKALAKRAASDFQNKTGRIDDRRTRIFTQLAQLADEQGILAAIHLTALIGSQDDLETLLELSSLNSHRLLGLYQVLGDDLIADAGTDPSFPLAIDQWPYAAKRDGALGIFLFFLAFAMTVLVLVAGRNRNLEGALGLFERLDRSVTRLMLGRNS